MNHDASRAVSFQLVNVLPDGDTGNCCRKREKLGERGKQEIGRGFWAEEERMAEFKVTLRVETFKVER